jgi:hypothetical protein
MNKPTVAIAAVYWVLFVLVAVGIVASFFIQLPTLAVVAIGLGIIAILILFLVTGTKWANRDDNAA